MVKIVTDSVSDIPKDYLDKYDITVVPINIIIDENTYKDGLDITTEQVYDKIKQGYLPKTSQANPHDFIKVFDELSKEGDEVLAILLSSKLSGTYSSALIAKQELLDRKIEVIDSKAITLTQGMLVIEAAKMAKEGKNLDEIKKVIEQKIDKMEQFIIFDTLEYAYKGGRISKIQYMLSNVLNLKIIITLKDGEMVVKDKVRGRKKAIKWIINYMKDKNIKLDGKVIGINHANDSDYLEELKEAILSEHSPKEIILSNVGCAVAAYSGLSAVAVHFEKED
ncbi:EDD domain protein, DegV family [Alkalithermobacter thermoalcaliphilus JW-YL-7 = DSM 7308]|uniref:DegV family protein n=1 Tax=Alkalithermobacter thermoalcaliphilus JW-YL-7 = DSM 7308 TaxID=1121328 RepID=A0A150FNT0_CLOPD|nr:degV family protein [[Clostridium] paradoxum JW-YL-7 = DSM 7308]SHK84083.1 EDD domain protein, DegV family [[Clostridium] paradoxum JW-YL-7 = DSM 7308]